MEGETPIKIVVADDHAIVRSGLRMLLETEEGFKVVAEAADVPSAVRYVRAHRPQVQMLDLDMPEDDPAFAREALRSGAAG